MKIFIITLLIMLIIIVGWFFLYQRIENTSSEFISSLNNITKNIQVLNWDKAYDEFVKVNNKWKQTRKTWTILLPHHEIDNIDLAMAKAIKYLESKNTSLSLGELAYLKSLFDIVKEHEALTITNVL